MPPRRLIHYWSCKLCAEDPTLRRGSNLATFEPAYRFRMWLLKRCVKKYFQDFRKNLLIFFPSFSRLGQNKASNQSDIHMFIHTYPHIVPEITDTAVFPGFGGVPDLERRWPNRYTHTTHTQKHTETHTQRTVQTSTPFPSLRARLYTRRHLGGVAPGAVQRGVHGPCSSTPPGYPRQTAVSTTSADKWDRHSNARPICHLLSLTGVALL